MVHLRARPWFAYGLRVFCSSLMFLTAYGLLVSSTFATRMRDDFPVQMLVIALSAILAFFPLLMWRRYLGALLVSAFLISGIGGYWWTTIPWDELIKDSGFPATLKPDILDYALIASPTVVAAFYAVVSRPSMLRADLRNRGADPDEIRSVTSMSFLAGAALLLFCGALSVAMWAFMSTGLAFAALAPIPRGVPALVIVGALATVAYALLADRLPTRFPRVPGAPRTRARSAVAATAADWKAKLWTRIARRRAPS